MVLECCARKLLLPFIRLPYPPDFIFLKSHYQLTPHMFTQLIQLLRVNELEFLDLSVILAKTKRLRWSKDSGPQAEFVANPKAHLIVLH